MKKRNLLILGMLCFIAISSNCKKIIKDMPFALSKHFYEGKELRIDGYYYCKYGNPEKLTIYFFYQNGILLHAGDGYTFEIEEKFANGQLYEKLKEDKYCWGIFNIDSNSIKFERYYPSDNFSKKAYIRSGEILNDTTFHIIKSIRSDGKEECIENEVYYFKQFSPKLDSTNNFIK